MRSISFLRTAMFASVLALCPAIAHADTVCDWFSFASGVSSAEQPAINGAPQSPDHARAVTQVALAMFEAANAIDHRYESYVGLPIAADRTASQEAAIATAAYRVLMAHFPGQKTVLDENYAIALAAVADPRAREAGRLVGEQAAQAALAIKQIDPAVVQQPYRPRTTPGVWVGAALPVIEPWVPALKPWFLKSYDEVRPPPPPKLTDARYTSAYDEVKRLGGRASTERTPVQTLMARYRITPDVMPTLRQIADANGRSLVANARLVALTEMVSDDAETATQAAKLYYNFWRPITAIRNAGDDGNPETEPDANWVPLIPTPNHPEYPCGHCTYASAVATVLKAEVGNAPPGGVHVASRSLPNSVVQKLPSFDDWVREVSFSRTLGGVHYRFSNEAGEEIGRKVALIAMKTYLRPLHGNAARPASE